MGTTKQSVFNNLGLRVSQLGCGNIVITPWFYQGVGETIKVETSRNTLVLVKVSKKGWLIRYCDYVFILFLHCEGHSFKSLLCIA